MAGPDLLPIDGPTPASAPHERVASWQIGGAAAFLAICGLVAGGLGWATAAALRLEGEQLAEHAEARASRADAPGPVAAGQLRRAAAGGGGRPAVQPLQRRLRRAAGLRQPRRGPAAGRRRRAVAAAERRPARLDAAALPARRRLRLGVAAGAVRQPLARPAEPAHPDDAGQRHAGADGPARRAEAQPQAGRTDRRRARARAARHPRRQDRPPAAPGRTSQTTATPTTWAIRPTTSTCASRPHSSSTRPRRPQRFDRSVADEQRHEATAKTG